VVSKYNPVMRRFWIIFILLLTTCQPTISQSQGFSVRIHPDGFLYVGDQVSFEIIPPTGWDSNNHQARVELAGKELGQVDFAAYGVGNRNQATFWWIWDTKDLDPGTQTFSFSILPDGPAWEETVTLKPASANVFEDSIWKTTTTICCTLFYISGTQAERDIDQLKQMVDEQAADVSSIMQSEFDQRVNVTFLPRLLGHGGFATDGIYVTYLDANIAGNITSQVVHHEMVHIMDSRLGGELRLSMLVEGLAVYLSGGHYKKEALLSRAAILLDDATYIPLETLINDFYDQQHEIGYLEAGALVEYLVAKGGWEKYQTFYRHMADQGSPAKSMQTYQISLPQLEDEFKATLNQQVVTDKERSDLRLTVEQFDSLRLYQQALDPSAYFQTAWLPDGASMRQKGIVADYLRGPDREVNRIIVNLLLLADHELEAGQFTLADAIFRSVNFGLSLVHKP
jgi:hypothetical protein